MSSSRMPRPLMDGVKFATQRLSGVPPEMLRRFQDWYRDETALLTQTGYYFQRVRTWPEGYPGDFRTLEGVYNRRTQPDGLGAILDGYCVQATLATAIRSRLAKLAECLNRITRDIPGNQTWLNVACGPCRELLSVPVVDRPRVIHCLDSDQNSLSHAQQLLNDSSGDKLQFHHGNAFRLVNSEKNIASFGKLSVVYSAGLFDYIDSPKLVKLLRGLYNSLEDGGYLVAPFKDANRYETFDYHWNFDWYYFLQRREADFRQIMEDAGVPAGNISVERDPRA